MCRIIYIGELRMTGYWLMTVVGLIAARIYICITIRGGKAGQAKLYDFATLLFLAMIAAFVGGKLLNMLKNLPPILRNLAFYRGRTGALWADLTAGRSFFGGFILMGLLWWWYIRRYKVPADVVSAIATPAVALFMVFARIGCFLSGCCYGVPVRWGVVFPEGVPAPAGVPLFPSQLAESAAHLLLFIALAVLSRRLRQKWLMFPLYLAGYGAARFVLEFWRGDNAPVFLHLTLNQWIGLALPFVAAALIWLRRRWEARA